MHIEIGLDLRTKTCSLIQKNTNLNFKITNLMLFPLGLIKNNERPGGKGKKRLEPRGSKKFSLSQVIAKTCKT